MLARLLGLNELGRVSHLELYLRHRWPAVVVLVLIVAAVGVAGMIYRRERGVSKRRRTVMGVLRGLLYAVIIILIFEPVLGIERAVALKRSLLVLVDTSESMGTQDQRKSRKELEESALALGLASWDKPSVPIERGALAEVSSASRLELARSLLDHPELEVFDRLARQHKLRLLSFGRKVEAIGGDADSRTEALSALTATAEATRLGGAIEEAVARYGGQDTAGVVLLTDGASNEGLEPEEAARRLGERAIPLFPVGIGLPHQPDVRIRGVVAQEAVFPGDRVPVRTRPAGTESVSDVAHPVLSDAGQASPVMTLESGEEANAALWALVRPLYEVPALDGPKPGAEALAVLPGVGQMGQPYPLIAWQRYRTGKSLFVGTDQLWRLRFKRSDTYHARFWGQVIQFLTLSRKLGEDRQIRLETDQKSCRTGDRIQIYANVLDDAFQPYEGPGYTVHIDQVEPPGSAQRVRLEPVKGAPGLYQGFFTPTEEGRYRVRTDYAQREKSNAVELQVVAVPLEQLERSMQEAALRKMAELSGGRYFRIHEVPSLPDAIAPDRSTAVERRDKELFDLPLVFVVLLGVAGTEWFLRRRYDLI